MPNTIDEQYRAYLAAKAAKEKAEEEFLTEEAALVDAIAAHDPGDERYRLAEPVDSVASLKVVRSNHWEIDDERLENRLSRHRWYEVTRRKVDRNRFWAAVKLDRIPRDIVRVCVSSKPKKPYITTSSK